MATGPVSCVGHLTEKNNQSLVTFLWVLMSLIRPLPATEARMSPWAEAPMFVFLGSLIKLLHEEWVGDVVT